MNSRKLNPEEETFIVEVQRNPPISKLSDMLTTMILCNTFKSLQNLTKH